MDDRVNRIEIEARVAANQARLADIARHHRDPLLHVPIELRSQMFTHRTERRRIENLVAKPLQAGALVATN